jgi:hypothetical protein
MPKSKALSFAALALGIALFVLIFFPPSLYGCALPFVFVALFYGGIAYYKHRRDTRLVHQAEQEQLSMSNQLPPLPPMSSKSSSRLYVPPPLQHKNR